MRILYHTFDYPQASEVYVEDELRHVLAQGVEAHVWACAEAPHPEAVLPGVRLYINKPIAPIMAQFKPDLVHLHWMHWSEETLDILHSHKVPITVRGHVDATLERLTLYCEHPAVKRLYLYPYIKERFNFEHPKISVVPIGVDAPIAPGIKRNPRMVLRAASTNTRNQLFFIDLAKRLPEFDFRLCICHCHHVSAPANLKAIRERVAIPLENLRIDEQVSKAGMAKLFNEAGTYLFTFPENRVAAMPLSIAQALAAGCYVLVPNQPALRAMVGEAGAAYDDLAHAAELLLATRAWSAQDWADKAAQARKQALPMLSHNAYQHLVSDWQAIIAHSEASEA